ncbi:MAG: AMP-binding protein [Myxococcota bacterium]
MNFIETIDEHIRYNRDRVLLYEMEGAREVATTNATLLERIAKARGSLRARGVTAGDRVVLLAPNSSDWAAADLAILYEGAIVVPMYARQEPKELVEMMHDCTAKVIVCADGALLGKVREAWGPESDPPVLTFAELFSGEAVEDKPVNREASDPVTIIYTSGTSGVPKGVILTVANVDFMLPLTRRALARLMGERRDDDRVFHYLPFCFAGSRIALWTQLVRDNPIWMSTNLDNLKEEFLAAKPHYFLNVPTLLERIKNGVEDKLRNGNAAVFRLYEGGKEAYLRQIGGRAKKRDGLLLGLARTVVFRKIREGIGPNLRCLLCGSAPLGEETQRWFEMMGIPVYQLYGLTETTAIVTMDEPRQALPGRVGHAIDGVELRLSDEGELQVRGPNIFAGYWGRDEATADAFDGEWFRTGDAAEVDASGNWRIIGRTKNILVPSSGHNVAPEPIEQGLLESIPGAEHVVLFGHGRPYLTAVVSGTVEEAVVERRIEEFNETLPHYRRIRKHFVAAEPFTPENGLLTANQKLRRRALEEHFAPDLDRLYS